jgi:hypothetical protein
VSQYKKNISPLKRYFKCSTGYLKCGIQRTGMFQYKHNHLTHAEKTTENILESGNLLTWDIQVSVTVNKNW